jgi:hypothetical protein
MRTPYTGGDGGSLAKMQRGEKIKKEIKKEKEKEKEKKIEAVFAKAVSQVAGKSGSGGAGCRVPHFSRTLREVGK